MHDDHRMQTVALDNCAQEAIHQIQLIQPHGFLIGCHVRTGQVTFASDNAAEYLCIERDCLLGSFAADLFDAPPAVLAALPDFAFRAALLSGARVELLAHRAGDTVVLEALPFQNEAPVSVNERRQIDDMIRGVGALHHQKSIDDFLHACATQIRNLSGYQRVFVYRFLPDWSGEVIAESAAAGTTTRFLGLRFPASDIPPQARELYRHNLLRIIGDVDARSTAVLCATAGMLLDQSHSLLRSASTMHLRYLQNMGVKATMTISLKDGELWGMVSCHHHEPRVPPVELRGMTQMLCALLAEVAVIRLDAILHQTMVTRTLQFRDALSCLEKDIAGSNDFSVAVATGLGKLATLVNFQGFGLMVGGRWQCRPDVSPELDAFLVEQARTAAGTPLYESHALSRDAALAQAECAPWAGLIMAPMVGATDSFLFLLRHEVVQHVKWAGAPGKETVHLANGLEVLSPRHSFDSWTQSMQGQSDPWAEEECQVALAIARTLGEASKARAGRAMQEELRMLGSCMEHLNDMVVVTDTETLDEPGPVVLYVNQAFVDHTGYAREEVVGRSPRLLQGPATERAQLDIIRQAMRTWSPVTVELINYRKNGEPFWVEISLAPIADRTGWYTHWVAIERDIDERKRIEKTMQRLVNYDPLTGLPNRRLLMDRLPIALSSSTRFRRNGALLFVDLDNFKDLNDTEGHHVGDDLLKQVSARLTSIVRFDDTVARLGGDEFVVMLENLIFQTDEAAALAQQIAEKIIASLAQPYDLSGKSYSTTASLGISLFHDRERGRSVEELLKQADFAMYQSKSAGRNTWRFFDPKTQAALVEKNALESDLKQAFAAGLLQMHYQPIVDGERRIVGVEALMRWNDPVRGWVSPLEFIAIAESSGLIVPLGKWAIAEACLLLGQWSTIPARATWSIAVNVSARQIRQADFVDTVFRLLAEHGCNPRLLKLELTESLLQHDIDATIAKMTALREIGVAFSIDDFGTGYSSLAYLQRLPISVLKIDRSFVRDIGEDVGDRGICMMILALGKTLNLNIVAEGVESVEQYRFLKLHHCDQFQGYLFSKAVPADALRDDMHAAAA